MKQLFFLFLTLLSNRAFAQVRVETIDFNTLQPRYEFKVNHKKPVQVKVINLNRKVFKVEDERSEEDYNVTLPGALKGIKLPGYIFSQPAPAIPGANQDMAMIAESASRDINEVMKEHLLKIKERAKRLNDAVLLFNEINHIAGDCSGLPANIIAKLNKATTQYLYNSDADPHSTPALGIRLSDTLFYQRTGAERLLADLRGIIDGYAHNMKARLKADHDSFQTILVNSRQELDNARDNRARSRARLKISGAEKALELNDSDKKEFKEALAEIEENYEKAAGIGESMFEFDKEDKLNTIATAFKTAINPLNYEYGSIILIPEKDETRLKLTITPADLNECTAADKKYTDIKLRAEGGLKLDVSTGAFVNGGNEDFLGSTYYYENVGTDSRKIVTAQRDNRLMLSVGALLHFYKRSSAMLKLGGSLGVSTTADFESLNFHAGPSLIIGDKDRFIITAGITLKSSSVLDQQFELNKTYSKEQTPDEIPTVTVFPKAGWFIGLTYNLSLFK